MRLALVAGTTATAERDGLSAAGADPDLMRHTPGADLDILVHNRPTLAPVVPVSPTGCPTPAVVTHAVRELLDFGVVGVDAGMARRTGAPTVSVGSDPGDDICAATAVPDAESVFDRARELGRRLPDDHLVVCETIPGGTTTALGVLTALGAPATVSSSLPENPLAEKRRVVEQGLDASDLAPGDAAGDPLRAIAAVGDPVLAAATGLTVGRVESETRVTLGGGTQMATVAGLVRHFGVEKPLSLATTAFITGDSTTRGWRRSSASRSRRRLRRCSPGPASRARRRTPSSSAVPVTANRRRSQGVRRLLVTLRGPVSGTQWQRVSSRGTAGPTL